MLEAVDAPKLKAGVACPLGAVCDAEESGVVKLKSSALAGALTPGAASIVGFSLAGGGRGAAAGVVAGLRNRMVRGLPASLMTCQEGRETETGCKR